MAPRIKLPRGVPRSAPAAVAILLGLAALVVASKPAPRVDRPVPPAKASSLSSPARARPPLPSPQFCDGCGPMEGSECRKDADCRLGLRCHQGLCLEGGRTCADDGACPVEGRCAGGRCLLGVRDCAGDGDCDGGLCALGHCEAPLDAGEGAVRCHNDLACPDGRCASGRCIAGLRSCLDDRDCPADFSCRAGSCAKP